MVTLNEEFEIFISPEQYAAAGIRHMHLPTIDFLFAPPVLDLHRGADFIAGGLLRLFAAPTAGRVAAFAMVLLGQSGQGITSSVAPRTRPATSTAGSCSAHAAQLAALLRPAAEADLGFGARCIVRAHTQTTRGGGSWFTCTARRDGGDPRRWCCATSSRSSA